MTLRWWRLLLVIPLTLVACGGGEKQTPEPSATASAVRASPTALVSQPLSTTPGTPPSPTPSPTLPSTAGTEPTEVAPTTTPEATSAGPQYLEGVFVVPADGSGAPVKLAEDGEVHGWSPDGRLIAITTLDPDQSGCNISTQACFRQLFLIRADGQGQPVSLGSGSAPQWSADGKRLLFYRLIRGPVTRPPNPPFTEVTAKEVCVVDAATGETTVLASWVPTAFFGAPTWSPDESRVLLNFGEPGAPSLYVVKADGSEPPVKLADGSGPTDWSPDSRRIVYSCGDYIYTVAADGSEAPRQLVPVRDPDWSPDGSRIAVEAGAFPSYEIWLIDPETAQGIKLVDGALPYSTADSVWSPDGSLILYQAESSLYALAPEGNAPAAKLGEADGIMSWPDIDPVWSPDGKHVAFRRLVGESENVPGAYQLLVVNSDGSGLTLLANDLVPACFAYAWSPDSKRIAFSAHECALI